MSFRCELIIKYKSSFHLLFKDYCFRFLIHSGFCVKIFERPCRRIYGEVLGRAVNDKIKKIKMNKIFSFKLLFAF